MRHPIDGFANRFHRICYKLSKWVFFLSLAKHYPTAIMIRGILSRVCRNIQFPHGLGRSTRRSFLHVALVGRSMGRSFRAFGTPRLCQVPLRCGGKREEFSKIVDIQKLMSFHFPHFAPCTNRGIVIGRPQTIPDCPSLEHHQSMSHQATVDKHDCLSNLSWSVFSGEQPSSSITPPFTIHH